MKLIATLATLAALIGQTEAATSAIRVESYVVGDAPCTDKVLIHANTTATTGATFTISSTKLSTKATTPATLHTAGTAKCDAATGSGVPLGATAFTAAEADGVTTWTITPAVSSGTSTCVAGNLVIELIGICNNGVTDYNGKAIGLKIKNSDDTTAAESAQESTILSSASAANAKIATPVPVLAAFTVVDMPVVKATTGPFEATWTGVLGLNGKKLVLNLPKDYIIPTGSTCNITSAKTSPTIVTLRASSAQASTTNSVILGTITAGTLDAASKTTLNCDKVTSGAAIAANADDAVSVKVHATSGTSDYVAYASALTPAPTKSPTAKSDDSPASVATASGVVVGALGVAALFLA